MFGYTEKENIVFHINREDIKTKLEPQVRIETVIFKVSELSSEQYSRLVQFTGMFHLLYLRLKYGFKETYILIAYADDEIAHVEWIVPTKKISKRYRFVTNNSYAIIGCVTRPEFRGKGVFASQIQRVACSDIQSEKYWIWAGASNLSSLKAIRKAGAVEVGKAVRKKWLFGLISKAELR